MTRNTEDVPAQAEALAALIRKVDGRHDLSAAALAERLVEEGVFIGEKPEKPWDKSADQDTLCICGHPYERHFDSYEDMAPVGCKYCDCRTFTAAEAPAGRDG